MSAILSIYCAYDLSVVGVFVFCTKNNQNTIALIFTVSLNDCNRIRDQFRQILNDLFINMMVIILEFDHHFSHMLLIHHQRKIVKANVLKDFRCSTKNKRILFRYFSGFPVLHLLRKRLRVVVVLRAKRILHGIRPAGRPQLPRHGHRLL